MTLERAMAIKIIQENSFTKKKMKRISLVKRKKKINLLIKITKILIIEEIKM